MSDVGPDHHESDVYLSSISFEVGARVAISDLNDHVVGEQLATLHREGIEHCRVSDEPTSRMASRAAEKTLAAAGVTIPDSVVYATESPSARSPSAELWDFLVDLDQPTLQAELVSGHTCGNLPSAIRAARNLVLAEGQSNVLLATADRPRGATRFLDNGYTVLSDAAASCLVGRRPPGSGFRLLGVSQSMRADLPRLTAQYQGMRIVVKGVKEAIHGLTDSAEPSAGGYDRLITGNYANSVKRLFATAAGMKAGQVYTPLASDLGHCLAADLLITLSTAEQTGTLRPGERILLIGASPRSWSCAAVEYVCAGDA